MDLPPERPQARLRAHYDIERSLAARIRGASREDRRHLYGECYDELFRLVPDHPQLARKASHEAQREAVSARRAVIGPFLPRGGVFMEIGPGDCSLSISMCEIASRVYAVDVSSEITSRIACPPNFTLVLSDGASIPVPEGTVDVGFSYQLIEHLHPDDTVEHLSQVYRALRPGGVYVCVTPSRVNGPHDISRYFGDVPAGFHLREYAHRDLIPLFRQAGFADVRPLLGIAGRFVPLPAAPFCALERVLDAIPPSVRRRLARRAPLYRLLGVTLSGRKPGALP